MNTNVKAVIDIGSNSFKLRVGQLTENGTVEALLDTSEVVQLGKGFVNGGISNETMQKALRVISEMVDAAREKGASSLSLVGTMALRRASNSDEFLRRVREKTGLDIRIISGGEEASYSWKGTVLGMRTQPAKDQDIVMFDTGGGSTEFVFGQGLDARRSQSLPIGAVSLTEQFLGTDCVPQASVDTAMGHVRKILEENSIVRASLAAPVVIGLGGGVVAMASVKMGLATYDPDILHGSTLTQEDLAGQIKTYAPLTLEQRKKIVGLPPARANVILGSACIVLCILKALDVPSCTVSVSGLRHAVLMEMFSEKA